MIQTSPELAVEAGLSGFDTCIWLGWTTKKDGKSHRKNLDLDIYRWSTSQPIQKAWALHHFGYTCLQPVFLLFVSCLIFANESLLLFPDIPTASTTHSR